MSEWSRPADLNAAVEFDCPFEVREDGMVRLRVPKVGYVPTVVHDDEHDMLIDGVPMQRHPHWEALRGFTRQDSYNGAVLHSSEYLGGGLARYVLETPGIYVLTTVGVEPDDDDPEPTPAGWTILCKREQ